MMSWHHFNIIFSTSLKLRFFDVVLHFLLLKKRQNGVLLNKMLNLILSTIGSDINVDASWQAQILQWVVM